MDTTLFISDLHLCATRGHSTKLFLRFLDETASGARTLYILGDFFEYWVGDDDLSDPFNGAIVQALRALSHVQVYFMHGNRDFLIGDEFAAAAGLQLLVDPHTTEIHGQRVLLMHGDTLCTDDVEYQRFRVQVRTAKWQQELLAKPLAERKALAESLRRQSETEKQHKSMDIMDVTTRSVEVELRRHGYPVLIHGHTHRPATHVHRVDGHDCTRWVLPDWYETGGYLCWDEAGLRAVTIS